MPSVWRTIRGYILWSYERGTIQYDVMVTLILAFIFLTPYWVNYNDKPIERNPHPTGVVIVPEAGGGYVYQLEPSAVTATGDDEVRAQLLRALESISGEVTIDRYEVVKDRAGRIVQYKVWARRE